MRNAKVIDIINFHEIIIDYGYKQGAKNGQKVRVVETGRPVYNLKNENLGTLDAIKAELEIVNIYENFSICSKITRKIKPVFSDPFNIEKMAIEPLNVTNEDISGENIPEITPIKKGDTVEILYN